jgi:hypothetical protein
MFKYPTQSDNLPSFVALLSTFWTQIYGGANLVIDYLRGCMVSQKQLDSDIDELVATLSRQTCPVFHEALWYNVDLLQSAGQPNLIPVGSVTYPWPVDAKEVNHMATGLLHPTIMMTNGVDFQVDVSAATILFPFDPFTDPRFNPIPVLDNLGQIIDYKLPLWFLGAKLDWRFIFEQFGYVIDFELASSQNYKDLVVALLDAISGATSYDDIARAVSAIVDIPIVKSDGEVVEEMLIDPQGLMIATDKFIYRFKSTATPIVAVGDVVNRDDSLIDAFYIFEPNRGGTPDIAALTIGPADLLDPSLPGPVTFNNAVTPLVVIPNVFGYTKLTWSLGGVPADVTAFFDLLHTKGIALLKPLAMCMDSRPQPQPTQPTAANLPATINPLAFLFQNVLRNNAFVVRLKTADFGPSALSIDLLSMLRRIVPVHTKLIVVTV